MWLRWQGSALHGTGNCRPCAWRDPSVTGSYSHNLLISAGLSLAVDGVVLLWHDICASGSGRGLAAKTVKPLLCLLFDLHGHA